MQTKAWIDDKRTNGDGKRVYRCVWIDPTTRRERSKSFRLKRDAEAYRTKVEHDLRSSAYIDPRHSKRTFEEVAGTYMGTQRSQKTASLDKYSAHLTNWLLPRWGTMPLAQIARSDVEEWVSNLLEGTAPASYRGRSASRTPSALSPETVRAILTRFSAVLSYAVEEGLLSRNVAQKKIQLPRLEDGPLRFLSIPELETLADAASVVGAPMDGVLVRWLGYTGTRIGEALALSVADLDLVKRRADIHRTWTTNGSRDVLGSPKTGRARKVSIPPFLVEDLRSLTNGKAVDAFIFSAVRGGPTYTHNWRSRVWPRAVAAAGLEELGITPHSLRHTAASMAIGAGADVKVVQNMLGHASATETLNRYGHLWPDRLDEVMDAVTIARQSALGRAPRASSSAVLTKS